MRIVKVNTATPYNVMIGRGALKDTGAMVRALNGAGYTKVCIVTDDIVASLYLDHVRQSLESAGYEVLSFVFPHGEISKNMDTAMELSAFLSSNYFTRHDLVAALGGGVTGDLAGFAASVYQRGVDFIQLPTTLLAAVDSSAGGKTAVNIPQGKNLVGSFWQPVMVLCDTAAMDTLTEEIFADGMAEVIKYGCIRDKELFADLTQGGAKDHLEEIIERCVRIKADIVAQDEKDYALRQILNFGHTAGHAVEKLSGFTTTHGKAVAVGMVMAAKAGEKAGITVKGTSEKIRGILEANGLPIRSPYPVRDIQKVCLGDKKREGGYINFVLLAEIGKGFVYPVATEELDKFF